MNDWWKAPVLQGPENDYGDYDYLLEEIPNNTKEWSNWGYKCSECGKYHKLNHVYTCYFRTMDGYDSMEDAVCWKCEIIKAPICRIKYKIKKQWKILCGAIEFKRDSKKKSWKKCYRLARAIYGNNTKLI